MRDLPFDIKTHASWTLPHQEGQTLKLWHREAHTFVIKHCGGSNPIWDVTVFALYAAEDIYLCNSCLFGPSCNVTA
jgi:hypothetical protein